MLRCELRQRQEGGQRERLQEGERVLGCDGLPQEVRRGRRRGGCAQCGEPGERSRWRKADMRATRAISRRQELGKLLREGEPARCIVLRPRLMRQ